MRHILLFLFLGVGCASAQAPKPLFVPATPKNPQQWTLLSSGNDPKQHPAGIVRARLVTIDSSQLPTKRFEAETAGGQGPTGARLLLNFFDDMTITAVVSSVTRKDASVLVEGTVEERTLSSVELIQRGRHLTGNVVAGDGRYFQIRPTSDGSEVHVIEELNPGQLPPELPPRAARVSNVARDLSMSTDDGSMIDVMVLYTRASASEAGGTNAMLSLISLAERAANQSYADSGVVQRIRVAHSEEVDLDPSETFDDALDALAKPVDGKLDHIHRLRDKYGADMVSLWITNAQSCGLGYLYSDAKQDFSASAFSVVCWRCVSSGQWSFAHELGHNQGTAHDRQDTALGLFPFSFGYQQTHTAPYCRTLEAYPCKGKTCPRVNLWSNPNTQYPCMPLGVAMNLPDAADDRETLNRTRVTAAGWRNSTFH